MSRGSEATQSDLDCLPRDGVDCYQSLPAATLTCTTLLCARDLALLGKHAFPPPGADHSMSLVGPWRRLTEKERWSFPIFVGTSSGFRSLADVSGSFCIDRVGRE